MPVADLPFGTDVIGTALALLAGVLGLIAHRILRTPDSNQSSEPVRGADMEQLMQRVADSEEKARQALHTLSSDASTRLDQHDRHIAQLVQSMSDNFSRALREKEIEDREQFHRVIDKMDRMRSDLTPIHHHGSRGGGS